MRHAPAIPSPQTEPSTDIALGRQPILDRSGNLVAYELLFRSLQAGDAANEVGRSATAEVVRNAFAELGLIQALGPYRGFINADAEFLLSDAPEFLPPERITLEILETVKVTPTLIDRCRALRAAGYTLALDDFIGMSAEWAELMPCIDLVKVDVLDMDAPERVRIVSELRNWPVELLAEKVETQEVAQHCLELGFDLFQGYHFARPQLVRGRKLTPQQATLLRALDLIMRDADLPAIEALIKHEPALVVNLLKLANSAGNRAHQNTSSLRQAMTRLGHRQLRRWLQLLLYTGANEPPPSSALLLMAAARARFMETLPKGADTQLQEQAFLTGILSLMPAALGMPLDEILSVLPVPAKVRSALLDGSGELGLMLALATALERCDTPAWHAPLARLRHLSVGSVNRSFTAALAWANEFGIADPDRQPG